MTEIITSNIRKTKAIVDPEILEPKTIDGRNFDVIVTKYLHTKLYFICRLTRLKLNTNVTGKK